MTDASVTAAYELWVEGVGQRLSVSAIRGREALSRPYSFEVRAVSSKVLPVGARSLVGRRVALAIREDARVVRRVRGVVAWQQQEGRVHHGDRFAVRLRVVPRLWLLRRRRTTRIFQHQSVVEIVQAVLDLGRVAHRWKLERRYPALEYCVQYQETDYDFVSRLLAEHGIFFYFEQPQDAAGDLLADGDGAGGTLAGDVGATLNADAPSGPHDAAALSERVVLCDGAAHYPPLGLADLESSDAAAQRAPELRYAAAWNAAGSQPDTVTDFALRTTARTTAVARRGYDFLNPLLLPTATLDVAARGEGDTPAALAAEALEDYGHHDEYLRPTVDRRAARLALEQHQCRVLEATGASACRGLTAGERFALVEHPREELNREYVVTALELEAHVPELEGAALDPDRPVFRVRFACLPAEVAHRPRAARRRVQQSLETATVVGPAGEEVYTDEHGRIKVQFHWDREGRRDEHSSCWLRVAQAWAGPQWGGLFIPRVGMEVLVAFVEGDTDRPLAVGCVYNGLNRPPYALPGDAHRSTIKSTSFPSALKPPGRVGFNELRFDDLANREQVYLHAERDLKVKVRNHHETLVLGSQDTQVRGHQSHRVAGVQSDQVGRSQYVSIGQDQHVQVAGNRHASVAAYEQQFTGGGRSDEVHGFGTELIRGIHLHAVAPRGEPSPESDAHVADALRHAHRIAAAGRQGVALDPYLGTVDHARGRGGAVNRNAPADGTAGLPRALGIDDPWPRADVDWSDEGNPGDVAADALAELARALHGEAALPAGDAPAGDDAGAAAPGDGSEGGAGDDADGEGGDVADDDGASDDDGVPMAAFLETYVVHGRRFKCVSDLEVVDLHARETRVATEDALRAQRLSVQAHDGIALAVSGAGLAATEGLTLDGENATVELFLGNDGLHLNRDRARFKRRGSVVEFTDDALTVHAARGAVGVYLGERDDHWGLTLADAGDGVTLRSRKGSSFAMTDDVTISAKQTLRLKTEGGAEIALLASGEIEITGTKIKLKGG